MKDVSICGVDSLGGGSIDIVSSHIYDSLNIPRREVPDSPLPLLGGTDRLIRQVRGVVKKASRNYDVIILPRDVMLAGIHPEKFNATICPIVHDLDHIGRSENDLPYKIALSLAKRHIRHSELILAISESTKSDLIDQLGVSSHAVKTFIQGVDTSKMYQDMKPPSIDVPPEYVLYVGGLMDRKRPDILAETIARLPSREFVVCGNTYSSEDTKRFKELIAKNGAADRVHMFGRVSMADLRRVYSNATVLLHTAEKEGYGRTPVEAATCGTPAILHTSIPSSKELGDSAITFSTHDPGKIAELVRNTQDSTVNYEPVTWEESASQVRQVIIDNVTS